MFYKNFMKYFPWMGMGLLLLVILYALYEGGNMPFLYGHEIKHGDSPVVETVQFAIKDQAGKMLVGVPVQVQTWKELVTVVSDQSGYANFYQIAWRGVLPVKLGSGYENCAF